MPVVIAIRMATVVPGGTRTHSVTGRLPDIRRVMAQGMLRIVVVVDCYRRQTIVVIVVLEAMVRMVVVTQVMQMQVVRVPTDTERRRDAPEPT